MHKMGGEDPIPSSKERTWYEKALNFFSGGALVEFEMIYALRDYHYMDRAFILGGYFSKQARYEFMYEGGMGRGIKINTLKYRMGRNGKAVEITYSNGSKKDINAVRVKQWVPNNHPNAPAGTLQKVKFKNSLPGSKGYKRPPTKEELKYLNK